jgi:hypothetical protein
MQNVNKLGAKEVVLAIWASARQGLQLKEMYYAYKSKVEGLIEEYFKVPVLFITDHSKLFDELEDYLLIQDFNIDSYPNHSKNF